ISIAILGALTGCGSKDIGKDKATEIALEDAGLTQTDVTRLRVSKDRDDGRTIYEVQFANENTEYDYEVEASNGEIMKVDMEETRQKNSQAQTDQTQTDQTQQG
ncbi:MAG: PepSY domain-containing protein, partial [Eubacteriales bacterium]|nr:PepSY domain-containing protein [Eubacteriales bacterium]